MATASTPARPLPAGPLLGAMVAGAVLAGVFAWRVTLQGIDQQIAAKRSAIRKLVLSGSLPPNQEVADYLAARQTTLEARYQLWLTSVATPPAADAAAQADPQLYFQEQFHEVQRALERLSAARGVSVPEQLGFPKELPPSDTVPRLLMQLSLMQEAAELVFEHQVSALNSLKVEDPQPVSGEEGEEPFVMRLPVRVRLTASLPQLVKILGAIEQKRPLIDVRSLRVTGQPAGDALEIELILARYLSLSATVSDAAEEELPTRDAATTKTKKPSAGAKKGKGAAPPPASLHSGRSGAPRSREPE